MNWRYLVVLGVSALALGGFWAWSTYFSPLPPDPEELAEKALLAPELSERVEAASMLTMIKEPDPTNLLRHVAENSNDPEVLIQALNGLSVRGDVTSLPLFFASMQHSSGQVRASAWVGVQRIYGIPEGLVYNPDGPADERARAVRRLKKMYDEAKANSGKA